jgi:hypothetical protein
MDHFLVYGFFIGFWNIFLYRFPFFHQAFFDPHPKSVTKPVDLTLNYCYTYTHRYITI